MNTKKILTIASIFIVGLLLGLLINSGGKKEKKVKVVEKQNQQKVDYWTCSMHPQIHADEPGNCPICGMKLIPANSSGAIKTSKYETMLSDDATKIADIQTSVVDFAKPEKEILLQGMIMPDETKITTQAIHFDGRIENIFVNYVGQKINKGQKIATIYSPDLVTAQQEFLQAVKYKKSNPLLYDAAKNKLKFWKLTDNQINNLEKNEKIIDNFTILAESSGYISKLNVRKGDYVKSGAGLFDIVNLSKVWVVFDAYEKDLPFIRVGDKIDFSVNSIPNKLFKTRINFISPIIDQKKRTYDVRTQLDNPGILLRTGMFTQGTIKARLNVKKDVLIVPKSAVLWTGTRSVVYVKEPNKNPPTYQLRVVTLGADLGSDYEIMNGLNQGEQVVTNGAFTIDAAAELAGNYSMLNLPENKNKLNNIKQLKNVSKDFINQVNSLIDAYSVLTNYLIASSAKNASAEASKIKNIAEKIDLASLDATSKKLWIENLNIIKTQAQNMVTMNNLDMQRKHYQLLSDAIIKLAKSFGHLNKTLYVQFCPMYNDNKGAFWLSNIKEIKNPYFGDLMLTCGDTKDTLKK